MHASRPLLILLLTAMLAGAPLAGAQGLRDRQSGNDCRGGISLNEAVSMAQSRYQAKAVKADTVGCVHQIRLLSPEGKVWTVRVDAETRRMY